MSGNKKLARMMKLQHGKSCIKDATKRHQRNDQDGKVPNSGHNITTEVKDKFYNKGSCN